MTEDQNKAGPYTERPKYWRNIAVLIGALLFVICVRMLVRPVLVSGESMYPTLMDGDIVATVRPSGISGVKRGDIVILDSHNPFSPLYIKRVIGLPGETVRICNGRVYIDGRLLDESDMDFMPMSDAGIAANSITLGDDQYFVLGDNRNESNDGRFFGPVDFSNIEGIAWLRLFPFDAFCRLQTDVYASIMSPEEFHEYSEL